VSNHCARLDQGADLRDHRKASGTCGCGSGKRHCQAGEPKKPYEIDIRLSPSDSADGQPEQSDSPGGTYRKRAAIQHGHAVVRPPHGVFV
jgi:hypothetical protein